MIQVNCSLTSFNFYSVESNCLLRWVTVVPARWSLHSTWAELSHPRLGWPQLTRSSPQKPFGTQSRSLSHVRCLTFDTRLLSSSRWEISLSVCRTAAAERLQNNTPNWETTHRSDKSIRHSPRFSCKTMEHRGLITLTEADKYNIN